MDSELFYLSPFMEEVCQGQNQYVGDPLFVILLSCYAAATLKKVKISPWKITQID